MSKLANIQLSENELKEISIIKEGELKIIEEQILIEYKKSLLSNKNNISRNNGNNILRELKVCKSVNIGNEQKLITEIDNQNTGNSKAIAKRIVAKGGIPILTFSDKTNDKIVSVGIQEIFEKTEKGSEGDLVYIVDNSLDTIESGKNKRDKYKTIELLKKIYVLELRNITKSGLIHEMILFNKKNHLGINVNSKDIYNKLKLANSNELLFNKLDEKLLVVIKKEFKNEAEIFCDIHKIPNVQAGEIISDSNLRLFTEDEQKMTIPFECFDIITKDEKKKSDSEDEFDEYKKNIDEIVDFTEPKDLIKIINKMSKNISTEKKYEINEMFKSEILFTTNNSIGITNHNYNKSIVITIGDYGNFGIGKNLLNANITDSIQKNIVTGAETEAINYFFKNETNQAIHQIAETCSEYDIAILDCKLDNDKKNQSQISNITYGIIDKNISPVTTVFKNENDFICIIGNLNGEVQGSEYLSTISKKPKTNLQDINSEVVENINFVIHKSIRKGLLHSAIKISDGGLVFALIESLKNSEKKLGANIFFDRKVREDLYLLGESQSVILVSIAEEKLIELITIAQKNNVNCATIGRVINEPIININNKLKLDIKKF